MAAALKNVAIPADLLSQAEMLEKVASLCTEAAKKMREADAILVGFNHRGGDENEPDALPPRINKQTKKPTRFGELCDFLEKHGPVDRQIIVDKSGVPEGSIRALLNSRNFTQDKDGKWGMKDPD